MELRGDRARARTAEAVLRRIDDSTEERLRRHAAAEPRAITQRLQELDREWDVDRVITAEAAVTGLAGLALGLAADRRFLGIPAFVGGALILYALRGWYPLLPGLRGAGVRTPREIGRERFALKALRGDFADLDGESGSPPAPSPRSGQAVVTDALLREDRT